MSRREHHYLAYGLHVTSDVPLEPFLSEEAAGGDAGEVSVRLGLPGGRRQSTDVEIEPDGAIRILIRDGAMAYIEPRAGLPPGAVAEYVSGIVLAVLLQQRGAFVMHASAVQVKGAVIAFTGRSGAGKSTTAAMFGAAGYPAVTDDFLPLRVDGTSVSCVSGPGALKLFQPQRRNEEKSSPLGKGLSGKWVVRPSADRRDDHVASLAAIYSLEDASDFGVTRMAGQHAIATLLRDAFCLAAAGRHRRANLLEQCAAVAHRVGVRQLRRPRDLGRADELIETVMADLAVDPATDR